MGRNTAAFAQLSGKRIQPRISRIDLLLKQISAPICVIRVFKPNFFE